jgi:hypothetical protein
LHFFISLGLCEIVGKGDTLNDAKEKYFKGHPLAEKLLRKAIEAELNKEVEE